MPLVDVDQLARSLNLTPRRISQLVQEGMPKAGRGQFDLVPCCEWYIRRLQSACERRENPDGNGSNGATVRAERARVLRATAEKLERENREASRQLVPIAEFTRRMSAMITQARQRLLQLPGRVAPQLEGEPRAKIKAKLLNEVYATLTTLATPVTYREPGMCDVCGQKPQPSAGT